MKQNEDDKDKQAKQAETDWKLGILGNALMEGRFDQAFDEMFPPEKDHPTQSPRPSSEKPPTKS